MPKIYVHGHLTLTSGTNRLKVSFPKEDKTTYAEASARISAVHTTLKALAGDENLQPLAEEDPHNAALSQTAQA